MEGFPVRFGDHWLRIPGGRHGSVYYHRSSAVDPWQVAMMFYPGEGLEPAWRLDYEDVRDGFARTLVVTGMSAGRLKLNVHLVAIELAPSLPADLFTLETPASTQPVSIEEVRARHLFLARRAP